MKEYRVYVFDYKKYLQDWYKHFERHVDADCVDNLHIYESHHKQLLPEAEKIIELCEEDGEVYTLETFFDELNNDRLNTGNYLFYTTNNY